MADIFLIKRPHVTEKAIGLQAMSKYVFIVKPEATKNEVKKWIEGKYRVHVTGVNVVGAHAKPRRYRNIAKAKSGYKKAVVTLREGEKIEAT